MAKKISLIQSLSPIMAPSLILVNSKGDKVELDFKLNVHMRLISTMIENLGLHGTDEPIEIPVNDIDSETLQLLKRYLDIIDQDVDDNNSRNVFVADLNEDSLFKLMTAANFLDFPNLLDLCTETVANMIRGKSPEEVREILNLECDFSEEELETVYRENVWLAD